MRARAAALVPVLALLIGLLAPTPASAVVDATVSFLHEDFHLYSPFPGPARIRLTWGSRDPNATLTFRLRQGGTVVHQESYVLETPGAGSKTVDFTWPAQSVSEPTSFQVTVHRGSTQLAGRTFEILPRLVRITSIRPDPFFPLVVDEYRDTTTVRFHLEANSNPVIVRIYRANAKGNCCSDRVRKVNLEDQTVGDRTYEWNGRKADGTKLRKGKYFVRITATKESFPEDVTRTSRPASVRIRRG